MSQRTQLTEPMVSSYDRVVVLAHRAESPVYLTNNPKVIFWEMNDPAGTGYESHVKTREDVKGLVKKLIDELE